MSETEWPRRTLLRIGTGLIVAFTVMYAVSATEIVLSFTPKGYDGPILQLYNLLGYQWRDAGYHMMLILTALLMIGAVAGYYGVKTIKSARSMS
jgi:hypothetical protein